MKPGVGGTADIRRKPVSAERSKRASLECGASLETVPLVEWSSPVVQQHDHNQISSRSATTAVDDYKLQNLGEGLLEPSIQQLSSAKQSDDLTAGTERRKQIEEGEDAEHDKQALNKKSWLHTIALWAFCAIYLLLIGALFTIRQYALTRQGFKVSETTSSYTWKYAPTALFVFIIAFWRQIDHQCKIQAPWVEMRKGFKPPQRTVLLDYVAPLLPSSMYSSLKNGNFEVSAGITVFGLLKLAVLFSTGLLVFENATFTKEDIQILLAKGGGRKTSDSGKGRYATSYYGAMEKGLQWPPGTGPTSAFQQLSPANDLPANSTVTTQILGFFPWLSCETAALNQSFIRLNGSSPEYSFPSIESTYEAQDCAGKGPSIFPCDPSKDICKPLQIQAGMQTTYCPILDYYNDGLPNALMIYLVGVETSQVLGRQSEGNTTLNVTAYSQSIASASMLLCATSYSIERAQLVVDTANPRLPGGTNISDPLTSTGNMIDGYTFGNMTKDLDDMMLSGVLVTTNFAPSDTVDYVVDNWISLVMAEASVTDLLTLSDYSIMWPASNQVFKGLISQYVGSWLSFPDHLSANGSYTYSEQRLHIHDPSLWGMAVALGLSVVCTVLILSLHNPFALAWQNNSVFSQGWVLSRSQSLREVCMDLGHLSDIQLAQQLFGLSFGLVGTAQHTLHIDAKRNNGARSLPHSDDVSVSPLKTMWWRPLPSRIWFSIAAIGVPVVVIIALEVLQRYSDANAGISDVPSSTSLVAAMCTYIPAIIMLTIASIFSAAEFAACLLAPHLSMKEGSATLRGLRSTYLRELGPVAIIKALSQGQKAVAVIISSALCGSLLTIISSGLYSIEAVPMPHHTFVTTKDQFNLQWNLPENNAASDMFTLVQLHNASYPSGTYNDIAFPLFSLDDTNPTVQSILKSQYTNTLEVEMPVIRPSLNCSIVSEADMVFQVGHNANSYDPWVNITTTSQLPQHCQYSPGTYKNSSLMSLKTTDGLWLSPGVEIVGGELENPLPPNSGKMWDLAIAPDILYASDCPSIGLTFGKFKIDATNESDITRLVCSQYQEEIPATLNFILPSLALDPSRPPVLHEERGKVLRHTSYNLKRLFYSTDTYDLLQLPGPIDIPPLDKFFIYLQEGVDGVPLAQLVGKQNQPRFINTTQHLYRQFMVQVLNEAMRLNVTNSTTQDEAVTQVGTKIDAQIFDQNRLRITQNKVSKLILQGMLGLMMICWAICFRMLRETGRVVMHNPCTMMGSLTLLAGSELVNSLALGREIGEEEWKTRLRSTKFRLGWWHGDENGHQMMPGANGLGKPGNAVRRRYGIDIINESTAR